MSDRWSEMKRLLLDDFGKNLTYEQLNQQTDGWAAYIVKREEELATLRARVENLQMELKSAKSGNDVLQLNLMVANKRIERVEALKKEWGSFRANSMLAQTVITLAALAIAAALKGREE